MHGLWALIGSGPLEPGFHVKLLNLGEPSLRRLGRAGGGKHGQGRTGGAGQASSREDWIRPAKPDFRLPSRRGSSRESIRLPILLDALSGSYEIR